MSSSDAHWPRDLRRKVVLLLVGKLCALMLIAWLFFPANLRPHIDGKAIAARLFATPPAPKESGAHE